MPLEARRIAFTDEVYSLRAARATNAGSRRCGRRHRRDRPAAELLMRSRRRHGDDGPTRDRAPAERRAAIAVRAPPRRARRRRRARARHGRDAVHRASFDGAHPALPRRLRLRARRLSEARPSTTPASSIRSTCGRRRAPAASSSERPRPSTARSASRAGSCSAAAQEQLASRACCPMATRSCCCCAACRLHDFDARVWSAPGARRGSRLDAPPKRDGVKALVVRRRVETDRRGRPVRVDAGPTRVRRVEVLGAVMGLAVRRARVSRPHRRQEASSCSSGSRITLVRRRARSRGRSDPAEKGSPDRQRTRTAGKTAIGFVCGLHAKFANDSSARVTKAHIAPISF